ncbi:MAG: hypothetical protein IT385_03760 [Deltaproteobacteria bacterium]|nr:hypothetical protein [Deltaproteobacteria bacterium]
MSLALGACPDDGTSERDTSTAPGDTSSGDSTDTTTSEVSTDTTTTSDATADAPDSGGSLDGTPLDGVGVTWSDTLVLCNAWQEGASRADELAHKVRVTLPPQVRTSLALEALGAVTLSGAYVETGPFADERWRPTATSSAAAGDYFLTTDGAYSTVLAMVIHDLGGAGRLVEGYAVTRGGDITGDVDAAAGLELAFGWAPVGDANFHLLEPCDAPDDFEDAAEVLTAAEPTSGGLGATLIRFYRTRHSELSAGSYPVRWQATQVVLSDMPWNVIQATGPWAHTYVAAHHNWSEASVVDLSRDLAGWQTIFQPLADDKPIREGALARVELADVGGGGDGALTLTRLASDGTPSTITMDTGPSWRRVDANHLRRHHAGDCAAPDIGLAGFSEHVAQLVLCPDAGGPRGKRLVGVAPVVWAGAPEVAGELLDKTAITTRTGGWTVAVGATKLLVDPQADGAYIVDIQDAQGTSLGSAYSELYPLAPQAGWGGPVAAVGTAGGDEVAVSIDRVWAAQGVGESAIYAVASVTLTWGERTWTVDAWDHIRYTNTHHNWNDTLVATSDDGHVIHWTITYDFMNGEGLVQRVWVEDAEGETVLGETIVTPRATEE